MTSARWNAGACGDLVQHVLHLRSMALDRDRVMARRRALVPPRRRSDHGHRHVGMEHVQRALQLAREMPACFEDAPIRRRRLVDAHGTDRPTRSPPATAPRLRALHDQHGAGGTWRINQSVFPKQRSPTHSIGGLAAGWPTRQFGHRWHAGYRLPWPGKSTSPDHRHTFKR